MLIYEKYRENHNPSKHGRLFSAHELLTYLPMWRNTRDILNDIIQEYDAKFELVHLLDRNGQYIKTL